MNCCRAVKALALARFSPTVTAADSVPEFETVNPPEAALARVAT